MHQGPRGARDRFYSLDRCPFCEALCEEGPEMAKHVRAEHGAKPAASATNQLAMFAAGA